MVKPVKGAFIGPAYSGRVGQVVMTQILEEKITYVVQNAFSTVLETEVLSNPAAMVLARGEPYITASIQITGAWKGVVSVHVPFDLGEEIAAIMFEDEIDFINTEDLEDAMGEITNIISGSFKPMLEGICHLGLPIVTRGTDYTVRFPGGTTKVDVGFECDDYCFHVSLIQANQD